MEDERRGAPDARALRRRRKAEHIRAVRTLPDGDWGPWFDYVQLIPAGIPECDWNDVTLAVTLAGLPLKSPIIINAMTGGTDEALVINRRLARVARRHGLAMAVGSTTAALEDPGLARTYTVVRDENPDGIVAANVGMGTPPELADAAIRLLGADLLQVHWNVAQELFMPEGDRRFRGALEALAQVARHASVPVVAKEIGHGFGAEAVRRLMAAGVAGVDVGGAGGTNFIAVEVWRRGEALADAWKQWGIPTAAAVVEATAVAGNRLAVVASGGIRSGVDAAKALALGATAVAIAGPFLRLAAGPDAEASLDRYVAAMHDDLARVMVLTGAETPAALATRPLVVFGPLREWIDARGLAAHVARRGRVAAASDRAMSRWPARNARRLVRGGPV